ncbi:hemin uptake protein HemP [Hydrogenophaga sp. ANAO-22]|jgi:hemin uptake protein HemP|uniref:hemin uptake protein HemP n=1 Tax=Hydrogenophaga sp. ANAO-22 TaxID=3166645 RepID=UPI0036D321C4
MQTLSITRPLLRVPRRVAAVSAVDADEAQTQAAPSVLDGLSSIDSLSLLQGGKCVQIAHNGSMYKLQSTKLGKLILTK